MGNSTFASFKYTIVHSAAYMWHAQDTQGLISLWTILNLHSRNWWHEQVSYAFGVQLSHSAMHLVCNCHMLQCIWCAIVNAAMHLVCNCQCCNAFVVQLSHPAMHLVCNCQCCNAFGVQLSMLQCIWHALLYRRTTEQPLFEGHFFQTSFGKLPANRFHCTCTSTTKLISGSDILTVISSHVGHHNKFLYNLVESCWIQVFRMDFIISRFFLSGSSFE
jgi:hypothetical protein